MGVCYRKVSSDVCVLWPDVKQLYCYRPKAHDFPPVPHFQSPYSTAICQGLHIILLINKTHIYIHLVSYLMFVEKCTKHDKQLFHDQKLVHDLLKTPESFTIISTTIVFFFLLLCDICLILGLDRVKYRLYVTSAPSANSNSQNALQPTNMATMNYNPQLQSLEV